MIRTPQAVLLELEDMPDSHTATAQYISDLERRLGNATQIINRFLRKYPNLNLKEEDKKLIDRENRERILR